MKNKILYFYRIQLSIMKIVIIGAGGVGGYFGGKLTSRWI